jgi:hypothetical protein
VSGTHKPDNSCSPFNDVVALNLSAREIQYAIDEIYARYGGVFTRQPQIEHQFEKLDWYHPKPERSFDDIDRLMSKIERENVKTLAQYRAMKPGSRAAE